jgi:transposase
LEFQPIGVLWNCYSFIGVLRFRSITYTDCLLPSNFREVKYDFSQQLLPFKISRKSKKIKKKSLDFKHETLYHARTFESKLNGPAECSNTQLDLFNHSVSDHTVAAKLLCTSHAPNTRCMMNPTPKPTYSQNWPAYTQAQTNEKAKFLELLFALCSLIDEPVQHMGRPRISMADRIFSVVFKTYECVSGRRFTSDLREAKQPGYLQMMPTYSAIFRYFESEELTPILKHLIIESSLPLKGVEYDFAVDSSGFSIGRTQHWADAKWGTEKKNLKMKEWVKAHVMCGVTTNIITSVEVTASNAGDSPQYIPLVEQTSKNFVLDSVSADKAYSASKNLQLTLVKGAVPYIPFRSNTVVGDKRHTAAWKRMYHFFMFNQEMFMRHYHKRSNVETVFSMIKRKFGEKVRSKTHTARVNEVLAKVLCHNLCCLIQSMYELGIDVDFGNETNGL